MILIKGFFLLALGAALLGAPGTLHAAEGDVGKVVAIRGAASITRNGAEIKAQVKGGIQANDTIKTGAGGRAKLLFIDDSVITMAEKSTLVIKEFLFSKGKEGRSIYNLLDGKMRSVVGKSKFEVRTPTAVAAARGTVIFFEVGQTSSESYSRIICLEGKVEVKNLNATIRGMTLLTPGTMVVVKSGEAPPPPAKAPPAELEKARKATAAASHTEQAASAERAGAASGAATSQGAAAGVDQPGEAALPAGSPLATSAVDTQDSAPSPSATPIPALSGIMTSGLGVIPPIQLPALKQPTRVNIGITIPTAAPR
jgi:hypothetical protein